MIVEYIPQNLLEALPDFDERERQTVLTHLSSALHHMHANTITHRDVKPDNALVQGRGQELTIKLADFGTSKHNAAGKMDTFTGTLIYMAPELFKKPRRYTDKVDMWSLELAQSDGPSGLVLVRTDEDKFRRTRYFRLGRTSRGVGPTGLDDFNVAGPRDWKWTEGLEMMTVRIE